MFGRRKKKRTEPLSEVFNQFAQQTVKDFPEFKGRFAVLDIQTEKYVGDVGLRKFRIFSRMKVARHLRKAARRYRKENQAAVADYFPQLGKKGLVTVSFNHPMSFSFSREQDVAFALDHELGHFAVRGAAYSSGSPVNFCECAADVFAMLKHIQRFGMDDTYIDMLARERSTQMLRGGQSHFTNMALYKLYEMKDQIDFKNLTPQKMTALAGQIAAEGSMKGGDSSASGRVFGKAAKRANRTYGGFLKSLSQVLCENISADEFKIGLAVLKPYMLLTNVQPLPVGLVDGNWNGVCKRLQEKEQKLAAAAKAAPARGNNTRLPAP